MEMKEIYIVGVWTIMILYFELVEKYVSLKIGADRVPMLVIRR